MMEELKAEEENKEGYKSPLEKPERTTAKGIYDVHVSTEMELYEKQAERRKLVNPKMYAQIKRKEEVDKVLLEKSRNRKLNLVKTIRMAIANKEKKGNTSK
eukprot:TRINITY_DN6967_c0_g1_i2.p1 TRINITY_DN6967_c0_g1~~TRINITY_DN6967_c0_g1_i2.p1  ORF type:complete len:101 (+),score=35.39 TRINITY_DN6967_c0_g1_i2:238-540(+)